MTNRDLGTFHLLVWIWIVLAGVVFVALLFVDAPYGRHLRAGWGRAVPARVGWRVMEAPAPLLVAAALAFGSRPLDAYSGLLGGLFVVHYVYRAIVFPLRLPGTARPLPLAIVGSAFFFNLVNGSIQGLWLGLLAPSPRELAEPQGAIGLGLFVAGAALHLHSDAILRRLRGEGSGYRVPTAGLFRFVSSPNYLGEIVEWSGYALLMGALPGWAFLAWTLANLVPRALAHHRWYRASFPEYPPARRALVPYLL